MAKYIALLRGINVSGQKIIKMEKLRASLAGAGLKNVQTYVQSGNIVFDAAENSSKAVIIKIEKTIQKDFGFEVPTIVLTPADLVKTVKSNPFAGKKGIEKASLYIAFFAGAVGKDAASIVEGLQSQHEKFVLKGTAIHLCYFKGYGQAKVTNNVFEKKLAVRSTCRNWNTCNELLKLAAPSPSSKRAK